MKKFFSIASLICLLGFCFLVFTSPSQCQQWYSPYSQGPYSQGSYYAPYSSPPINININMGGFRGSSPMGYNPYPSSYQPYPSAELLLEGSVADGDYIYVLYNNMLRIGGSMESGEAGLAIFEASGSDDYDYVSRIALFKGGSNVAPTPTGIVPTKIVIQDDLAVIGCFRGPVFFVDISDKDDPDLINTLNLSDKVDHYEIADTNTLAMKDDLLFVVMSEGVMGEDAETTIYAYDISDPDDTDEDDDLLDSYTIDNFDIHTMVIDSGYLYAGGHEDDDEPSILVFDISDPENLSLEETFTDLDGDDYSRVDLAVKGDYLMATITLDQDSSDYEDHGFKFKIINISDPENPSLVYSSSKMEGIPHHEQKSIAFSDNHVFLLTTIGDHGNWMGGGAWWTRLDEVLFESKVYVFDVSDPANADKVETSSKYDGAGRGIYVASNDRLCLQTDTELKIFDISDPTDLSLEGTVEIYNTMDSKLDDNYLYYTPMSSSPYYGNYGSPYNYGYDYRQASYSGYNPYSNFNTYNNYSSYPSYSGYGIGTPYGGYSNYGVALPDYGGPYFGGYNSNTGYNSGPVINYESVPFGGYSNYGYGTPYGGYGASGYSGWGGSTYGGYGFNAGYNNNGSGYGYPPYGGYSNGPSEYGYGYQPPYNSWW